MHNPFPNYQHRRTKLNSFWDMHFCAKKNLSENSPLSIFESSLLSAMLNRITVFVFLFCGSVTAQKMNTQQYIEEYKYAAMQEMKIYGIPASVTLAQGILESASGNSQLAKDCNNHFGIKCRKNWTGSFCLADDDAPEECFRGYANAMESYRDHSLFLKGSSRYDFLFALPETDYRAWAHGLRQAGYATNPAYGNIIVGVIERYRLSMYDSMMVLGEDYESPDTAASRLLQVHGLPAVIAQKNQKPEDIAKQYDLGVWQVYKYNDLQKGEDLKPGEIIYLKPKRRKAVEDFHLVKEGETLRDISQQHAVKLKHLEKFNDIISSRPLRAGEIIYLREKREKDSAAGATVLKQSSRVTQQDTFLQDGRKGDSLQSQDGQSGKERETLTSTNPKISAESTQLRRSLVFHTVVPKETIYSISRLYKITIDSVMAWNNLIDSKIKVGQELRVQAPLPKSEQIAIQRHTVQAGETLYQIARKYGVLVSEIQARNDLQLAEIKIGQVLIIP